MSIRLTKRQTEAARALLETPTSWVEFDRLEWRYLQALHHLGYVVLDREPTKKPAGLTFEAQLVTEKVEELRWIVEGGPAPPVRISYEVRYLNPIGGKTVVEPVPDKEDAFERRTALNLDLTKAIPNTVEIIEVSRKRIA